MLVVRSARSRARFVILRDSSGRTANTAAKAYCSLYSNLFMKSGVRFAAGRYRIRTIAGQSPSGVEI